MKLEDRPTPDTDALIMNFQFDWHPSRKIAHLQLHANKLERQRDLAVEALKEELAIAQGSGQQGRVERLSKALAEIEKDAP